MKTLDPPAAPRRELAAATACLAAALFFAWLFHERYWRWRDCIAAAKSSCVTPDGQNLTRGGALWALFALVFLLMALERAARAARSARTQRP